MVDPVTPNVAAEVAPPVLTHETPLVAPVEAVETVIAPVASEVPAAQEAPPVASVEPVVAKEATLLGADPIPETAPVVNPAEGVQPEAIVTEGGQSDEPAPPPKYESFVYPEGLSPDDTKLGEFTNFLTKLELEGKADHATVQAVGQDLVNFHIAEVQQAAKSVTEYYTQTWEKSKQDWKEAVVNDPELGGNRLQTNLAAINTFLRTHGGTAEQVTAFRNVMETTGLGNHPDVIRLLVNVSNAYREGTPLTASRPVQATKSKTATMYGKS